MNATIEKWLNSANGRRLDYDGAYGLQCVDTIDAYAEDIFGVPWESSVGGVGGAKELLDRAPDAFWIRIDNDPNNPNQLPQRGDVLVWAGTPDPSINPFGHTAICLSANANGVTVVQQDGFAAPLQFVNNNWYSNKPAHIATLGWDNYGTGMISGWLRPRTNKIISTGDELTMSEFKELNKKLDRIIAIVTENQNRIDARPTVKEIWNYLIWGRTQPDPGKNKNNSITVIQELANVRSWQINRDPELQKSDIADAIQDKIEVTVAVKEKDNVGPA